MFKLDGRIRYFGFMDNRLGMVVSELRDNVERHPGEDQLVRDLTFFKGAMSSWSLYFGRVNYSIVAHDHFKIIMIPVEAGLVIVTTEASFPLTLIDKLNETVRNEIHVSKL